MKYYESKISKIFSGKSFYLILALCLVAIGAAAWMAMDNFDNGGNTASYDDKNQNISSMDNTLINSDSNSTADDVDANASEPYEEVSSKEEYKPQQNSVANNFIMPLNGNVAKAFSDETLVYSNTYKDMRLHIGIDIVGNLGDEIHSCGNGVVVAIIDDAKCGKYVEIDHGNEVVARYCGFDKISVKEDDVVTAGTKLGTLGTVNDECLDKIHLHLEFHKAEKPVDPLKIIYPNN